MQTLMPNKIQVRMLAILFMFYLRLKKYSTLPVNKNSFKFQNVITKKKVIKLVNVNSHNLREHLNLITTRFFDAARLCTLPIVIVYVKVFYFLLDVFFFSIILKVVFSFAYARVHWLNKQTLSLSH